MINKSIIIVALLPIVSSLVGSAYAYDYINEDDYENQINIEDVKQENEDGDNNIIVETHQTSEDKQYQGYNYRDAYVDYESEESTSYHVIVNVISEENYDHIPDMKVKIKDQTKQIRGDEKIQDDGHTSVKFNFDDYEITEGDKFKVCLKSLETIAEDINVCHQLKRSGTSDKTTFTLY